MSQGYGKVVWQDIMTSDEQASIDFYTSLIGWELDGWDMGDGGVYRMIKANGKTHGGFMKIPPGVEAPPHWLCYISVEDVDAATDRTCRGGGLVMAEPMDIPKVGRFSIIRDPQGAVVSLFRGNEEMAEDEPTKPMEFCWHEVMTSDPEGAKRFYSEVVGWKFEYREMGPGQDYWTAKMDGKPRAGLMQLPSEMPAPPHWMLYVFVEDLDATIAKVPTLGGKVVLPKMPIPGVGNIALIQDNVGAVIGLHGDPIGPDNL